MISGKVKKRKLVLVTTVPSTLSAILMDQPRFLNKYFDVTLVSSDLIALEKIGRKEGVPVCQVEMVRGISPVRDIISVCKMIRLFLTIKPDIVHTFTPKAGLVGMISGKICCVPFRIHTFTGLIFPTKSGFIKFILSNVDRLIAFCATVIVPESLGVRSDLLSYRITHKPLKLIGKGNIAGVDTAYFNSFSPEVLNNGIIKRDILKTDGFVFCYAGRLTKDKGISELVNAFSLLPKNCSLLLIGSEDSQMPLDVSTRSLINSNDRIVCTGFVDDVRPYLAISDILVLPSYREGFPNVLLQAGAMSLPCISTKTSGSAELIIDNFNGWIVPIKNVTSLHDRMLSVTQMNSEELKIIGRNARAIICRDFERNDHWERLLEFYNGF